MVRRPPPSEIPDRPGVYVFRDAHGAVLYVGKAKSLRKRLASYFTGEPAERTRTMVAAATEVDWTVTDTEVAALLLEFNLIKRHRPRFNIRLRDDKSFPYLVITRNQEWPRVAIMRGKRRKGAQYFGPYAHAHAIRSTLDLLLRTFPIRNCSDVKYRRHEAMGRPCLQYHIERCAGPCIGEVTPEEYDAYVDGLAAVLEGRDEAIREELGAAMHAAAEQREFEQAARLRDRLAAVDKALERQEIVSARREDFDLLAVAEDDLEAGVVVLYVRHGRVVGRRSSIVDKVEDVTTGGLIARMLSQLYGDERPPRRVLVQELPEDAAVWEDWLQERRGGKVSLRVPQRGAKRRLLETARANAEEDFARHRLRRQSDHNARARALQSLQEHLGLPAPPLRIECYDISTIQGSDTVGSMVVLEDGLPRRSDYKRFKVRTVPGQDDFAAMEEVLARRFRNFVAEQEKPAAERGRFAYPPSLVLIDGGAGQLGRAVRVLDEYGLDIPVAGLAKRMEEVYLPGRTEPVNIPRGEDALYLLQRVRDEAHRFALAYHRTLRGKRMIDSVLDSVPGIGPGRKKQLLRRFGSLKRMRAASEDALAEVVPSRVAADLYRVLHEEETP